MLFRETVAVYRENHTEHTNTLCGQKSPPSSEPFRVLTLLRIYCCGKAFTKPLTSNDRLFCLHYSGLLGGKTERKYANKDYLTVLTSPSSNMNTSAEGLFQ
jgi:hypothetical protein